MRPTRCWDRSCGPHRNGSFAVYRSNQSDGHVFYRNLRRGRVTGIPVVLVIHKEYVALEKKIQHDRDRNAFGRRGDADVLQHLRPVGRS